MANTEITTTEYGTVEIYKGYNDFDNEVKKSIADKIAEAARLLCEARFEYKQALYTEAKKRAEGTPEHADWYINDFVRAHQPEEMAMLTAEHNCDGAIETLYSGTLEFHETVDAARL